MRLAVMQPYFLPYIGYFQLISAADLFIVYDNIKYTKKGWINRNRMLLHDTDATFSIPLKKASDSLTVVERTISEEFNQEKLINKLKEAYQKAPYFTETIQLVERIIRNKEKNLFKYIHNSIIDICNHLNIRTKISISSKIDINHELKSQEKIIALCHATGANHYINPIGGIELYQKTQFNKSNLTLAFIQPSPLKYQQFSQNFVPNLSIVDVLMFNPLNSIQNYLSNNYELL